MPDQIVLLAPERLHEIIKSETEAGRRTAFAMALLNLLETHCAFMKHPPGQERRGTILANPADTRGPLAELSWGIIQDPRPGLYGGFVGDHVLNGALIQHRDLTWSNHT